MKALCIEQSVSVMARDRKTIINNYEFFRLSTFSARIYEQMFGLNEVPVAGPGEIDDLFDKALSESLKWVSDPSQIRIVIHVHTGPTVGLPGAPTVLAALRRAGLHEAVCFGVCCNRCVSLFNGLDIAKRYLSNEPDGARALLLSGEVAFTDELRQVQNVTVAGDGVGAMLVNLDGLGDRVLSCEVSSDGKFAKGVWLEGNLKGDYETNYRNMLFSVVQRALEKANARLEDISWLVPHNTNISAWRFWAQSVGFPIEKLFLKNIPRTAHCFCTDLITNHAELRTSALSTLGEFHLMAAAGLGGMFGAMVIECRTDNASFLEKSG